MPHLQQAIIPTHSLVPTTSPKHDQNHEYEIWHTTGSVIDKYKMIFDFIGIALRIIMQTTGRSLSRATFISDYKSTHRGKYATLNLQASGSG